MRLFGRHRRDLRLWAAELGFLPARAEPSLPLPPFERVAADLRRVRRMKNALPQGTSWVRVAGVERAYDDLLCIACAQLHVQTTIRSLPLGDPRDLERARVEYVLGENGLLF